MKERLKLIGWIGQEIVKALLTAQWLCTAKRKGVLCISVPQVVAYSWVFRSSSLTDFFYFLFLPNTIGKGGRAFGNESAGTTRYTCETSKLRLQWWSLLHPKESIYWNRDALAYLSQFGQGRAWYLLRIFTKCISVAYVFSVQGVLYGDDPDCE